MQRKIRRNADFANLDLNLLRVFDAILRDGNLTAAGRRLGRSTAAVSHALARLRRLTGDNLFESTRRGMSPTHRALEMAPYVRTGLEQLRTGLLSSAFDPSTTRRSFTIDIPSGTDVIIAPKLSAYSAMHTPGMSFRIVSERSTVMRNELRFGETDLAIDYENEGIAGMVYEQLFESRYFVLSRRNHPAFKRGRLTRESYFALDHVGLGWTRTGDQSPLTARLAQLGYTRNVRLLVPTIGAIPPVIQSTELVATLTDRMAKFCTDNWNVSVCPLPVAVSAIPIFLVWHERCRNDPGHAWVRETLKKVCRET